MRHHRNLIPTSEKLLFFAVFIGLIWPSHLLAFPVYTKLDSPFPSGNYSQSWLETHIQQVQIQRWFKVETSQHVYGWIPEHQILSELHLTNSVVTTEDVPVRKKMEMPSDSTEIIPRQTHLTLKKIEGSWAKTVWTKNQNKTLISWIPTESLQAKSTVPSLIGRTRQATKLFVLPSINARWIHRLPQGQIVHWSGVNNDWVKIRWHNQEVFIARNHLILSSDFSKNTVWPQHDHVILREEPRPDGAVVTRLLANEPLKVLRSQLLHWGQSRVPSLGHVWWPMVNLGAKKMVSAPKNKISGQAASITSPPSEMRSPYRLTTKELFSREIFDLGSNPLSPSEQTVSADGVFISKNGIDWKQVTQFKEDNYPVAYSPTGEVFVGPYVSRDSGQSFQQWIKWDSLIAEIKNRNNLATQNIRIIEIQPYLDQVKKMKLKISIAPNTTLELLTTDQGQTWKSL